MRKILISCVALIATSAGAQSPEASFCGRLAPQLGMKQKLNEKSDVVWEVNTLGGAKTFLLGGSTTIAFNAEPVGEPTVEDYQRLQGICGPSDQEIVCRVVGPLLLTVQAKGSTAQVEAAPGEQATVATRKTRITCQNN